MSSGEDLDSVRRSTAHLLLDDPASLAHDEIVVADEIEHHLLRVLRITSGESVSVTDGRGGWRIFGAAVQGSSLTLTARSGAGRVDRQAQPLSIATAIPKGDRVDWLVQKATELGADHVTFVHADRSVVRWKADRAVKQVAKLQRVADEALRQSRRLWRMTVDGPVDAERVLGDHVVAEPGGRRLESGDRAIAIGPEGGWSDHELARAGDVVTLGPSILRTETAAIAAVTVSQFLSG